MGGGDGGGESKRRLMRGQTHIYINYQTAQAESLRFHALLVRRVLDHLPQLESSLLHRLWVLLRARMLGSLILHRVRRGVVVVGWTGSGSRGLSGLVSFGAGCVDIHNPRFKDIDLALHRLRPCACHFGPAGTGKGRDSRQYEVDRLQRVHTLPSYDHLLSTATTTIQGMRSAHHVAARPAGSLFRVRRPALTLASLLPRIPTSVSQNHSATPKASV